MRVWWMLAPLSLLACNFEHGVAQTDARIDAPADRDRDGDGVPDSADNCVEMFNADQRDHDGDGRGDACDLCPHLPSASDVDSDADGIGDSCDPRPTQKDRVMLWEGFYDASSLDNWIAGGAATLWTWQNGSVGHDETNPGDRTLGLPTNFQRIYVATGFELGSTTSSASVGMCSSIVSNPLQFHCCTVRAAGPALYASTYSSFTGADVQSAAWNGSYATGTKIQLVQNTAVGNRCDASQGTTTATRSSTLGPTNGLFQLTTAGAGARFDYVFIVEIGN